VYVPQRQQMPVECAMRKIQSADVDPRLEQPQQRVNITASRAHGRNYFGSDHFGSSIFQQIQLVWLASYGKK
jgi:hypothetical protein